MNNFPSVSMPATDAQQHHACPVNLYMAFAEQELGDDNLPSVTAFVETL